MSNKISALDVREFFKSADLELTELVLSIAGDTVATRQAARKEASDRMAKARAGRGKGKGKGANSAGSAGSGNSIPAPAHTAEATSVEADAVNA